MLEIKFKQLLKHFFNKIRTTDKATPINRNLKKLPKLLYKVECMQTIICKRYTPCTLVILRGNAFQP